MQHLTSLARLQFRDCFGTAIKLSVLYICFLFQNEPFSLNERENLVVDFSIGGFICATSSGTLVMELHG